MMSSWTLPGVIGEPEADDAVSSHAVLAPIKAIPNSIFASLTYAPKVPLKG
jgi:hypothetical protein